MNLNQDVRPFVHKNAVAIVGTDGLVGNTIINLNAAPPPRPWPPATCCKPARRWASTPC